MPGDLEIPGGADGEHDTGEGALVLIADVDVLHPAALDADEMMMMAAEPLGELEERHAVAVVRSGEHPGVGEHRQRAIQRRERDPGPEAPVELRGRPRSAGSPESSYHEPAALRVANTAGGEPLRHPSVQVPEHRSRHRRHATHYNDIDSHNTTGSESTHPQRWSAASMSGLRTFVLAAAALFGLVAGGAGCGDSTGDDGQGMLIIASTSILGDITGHIAGDLATVETLIGPGQDPHDFRPSAAEAARLRDADLVVVNGLGLEEGLTDVVAAAAADGVAVLEVGPAAAPLPLGGDANAASDPHVWLDPERMAAAVTAIGEALAAIDEGADGAWRQAAQSYRQEILATHALVAEILAPIAPARRVLVTNHDSLGYFAARYGFEIVGSVIASGSTLAEPSAADLASLVAAIRSHDVPAIFAETTAPARLAEAVASELGGEVAVVELFTGSLGQPGSGAATYLEMLATNARRIAAALTS